MYQKSHFNNSHIDPRADNIDFIVGIMHTNRLDLLSKVMPVINSDMVYLLDNSDNGEYFGSCIKPTVPLTYSQGMNWFRKQALKLHCKYMITMHEDIKINEYVWADIKKFASELTGDKWGVVLTNEDCVAIYNTKLLEQQNWDTHLPDYFADTDFFYWAKQKGFDIIQSPIEVYHYRSQTIMSDERKLYFNKITYPLYEQYYVAKTGGKRDHETFDRPFDCLLFK